MKKIVLTLAAVLALSGSAFAASAAQPVKHAHAATCVDTKTNVKLDCASTGSVEKKGATENTAEGKGPRLGISINPWIVPSAF
jgi:opacity protein-like surface antigen